MTECVGVPYYALKWMEDNGWPLNRERTAIHPNLLPAWVQRRARVLNEEVVVLELVFFTRFELRKGIVLFCDLLDQLALRGDKKDMAGEGGSTRSDEPCFPAYFPKALCLV